MFQLLEESNNNTKNAVLYKLIKKVWYQTIITIGIDENNNILDKQLAYDGKCYYELSSIRTMSYFT